MEINTTRRQGPLFDKEKQLCQLCSAVGIGSPKSIPPPIRMTLVALKQNWQHNHISFHRGHAKIRVPIQESALASKAMTPLYAEEIHMLERLEDEELERYLDKNPRIVPLFEIDVDKTRDEEPNEEATEELRRA